MITLTRGIGDRNEGRGEERRVFVSSLFLPVPRIPFLPDARNLQPSVFFFFEGIGRRRRPSKGREEEEHATARPPFSTSLVSFFFHFFFFPFPPINDISNISFFRSVQIRGRRAYERVCAKGKVGEKFRGRREGEMGQGSKLRFAGKEEREGKKGGKGEREGENGCGCRKVGWGRRGWGGVRRRRRRDGNRRSALNLARCIGRRSRASAARPTTRAGVHNLAIAAPVVAATAATAAADFVSAFVFSKRKGEGIHSARRMNRYFSYIREGMGEMEVFLEIIRLGVHICVSSLQRRIAVA